MNNEIVFIIALITLIAFTLFIITFFSFFKSKNKKLLPISFVFLFLFIRGVMLSLNVFYDVFDSLISSGYIWFFDLIVLLFLYAAYSIKR